MYSDILEVCTSHSTPRCRVFENSEMGFAESQASQLEIFRVSRIPIVGLSTRLLEPEEVSHNLLHSCDSP
jgi:hypothetical protein